MFNDADFAVFEDPTLAGRMAGIKNVIDPKFEQIADSVSQQLHQLEPVQTHIAQHLRRHKNPPMNTWIAYNQHTRGYKMTPHLMLGFWNDRLFLWLACLAEAKDRLALEDGLESQLPKIVKLGETFDISGDHMAKPSVPLTLANAEVVLARYRQVKQADVLIGRQWYRHDPIFSDDALQQKAILQTTAALQPFYDLLVHI